MQRSHYISAFFIRSRNKIFKAILTGGLNKNGFQRFRVLIPCHQGVSQRHSLEGIESVTLLKEVVTEGGI